MPTIVEKDGEFEMAIGASGGSFIITATVQAMINAFDWNYNIQEAISRPRLHHQLLPDVVCLDHFRNSNLSFKLSHEPSFDEKQLAFLRSRGHKIKIATGLGDVQAVWRLDNGLVHAGADPRKAGHASAY